MVEEHAHWSRKWKHSIRNKYFALWNRGQSEFQNCQLPAVSVLYLPMGHWIFGKKVKRRLYTSKCLLSFSGIIPVFLHSQFLHV